MIELLQTFFFLFAVIDPLGSIPVFLEATKQFDNKAKKRIAIKSTVIASLILLFFIVIGQIIMETMHITLSAFQISGGVILFLFALTMVFGNKKIEEKKGKILSKIINTLLFFRLPYPLSHHRELLWP